MGRGSMTRTLAVLIAGAAVVLVSACGGDDDDDTGAGTTAAGTTGETTGTAAGTTGATTGGSPSGTAGSADAQAYVDAMIESFDNADPDELQIDRDQAQCLAPKWVETIGPDRLAAAGVEPRDFAEEGDVDLTKVGMSQD